MLDNAVDLLNINVYSRKKESVSENTVENINNIRRINMKF